MKPVRLFFDLSVDVNCKEDKDENIYVDVEKLSSHIKDAIMKYLTANEKASLGNGNKALSVGVEYNFDELIDEDDEE